MSVVGVDGDPTAIPGTVVLHAGRWPRRSDELVVGRRLAHEKRLAVGDTLRLNERDFRIVGIGRMRGVGYGSDGYAYMEYRELRQRADLGDVVNVVIVDFRGLDTLGEISVVLTAGIAILALIRAARRKPA